MAGSAMTFTYDEVDGVHRAIATWTSDDAAGTVTGTTKKLVGTLIKGVTNPDGTAAPTALYDITLKAGDTNGQDLLGASADNLADRATATIEEIYFGTATGVLPVVCDRVFVSVAAAGNSKQGVLELYFRP